MGSLVPHISRAGIRAVIAVWKLSLPLSITTKANQLLWGIERVTTATGSVSSLEELTHGVQGKDHHGIKRANIIIKYTCNMCNIILGLLISPGTENPTQVDFNNKGNLLLGV